LHGWLFESFQDFYFDRFLPEIVQINKREVLEESCPLPGLAWAHWRTPLRVR